MLNARRPRPAQPRRLRAGELRNEAEWLLIDAALKAADYNRSRAAKLLGIGERTLRRKLNAS